MKTILSPIYIFCLLAITACQPKKVNPTTYQTTGQEVTAQAQAALLMNVSQAMMQGGPINALEFCNLNAASIVDSLNKVHNCIISRVSEKNRNIKNHLSTNEEKMLWDGYKRLPNSAQLQDTVIVGESKITYYKPIKIGMPACLKCHGSTTEDISTGTLEKINELYPADKARNYKMGELRGLWKVEFE